MIPFCHLHVHSTNSFRDGLAQVGDLVAKAAFMDQPGVTLTDHGVLYGMPSLFKACKEFGLQAIPGMEAYEAVPHTFDMERDGEVFKVKWADLGNRDRYFHITLWAMNTEGWLNLTALHTRSWMTEFHPTTRGKPLIDRASLEQHNAGLMMGLGCPASRSSRALERDGEDAAYEVAKWNAEVFQGRCYMEIMGNLQDQVAAQRGQIRVAKRLGIPVVAVNDVHYLDRKHGVEHGAHHTLVKSRQFKKADTEQSGDMSDDGFGQWYGSDGFFMKSGQEMLETGFQPVHLEQTIEVLERVDFDFDSLPQPSQPQAQIPLLGDNPEFDAWAMSIYHDEDTLRRYAGDLVS